MRTWGLLIIAVMLMGFTPVTCNDLGPYTVCDGGPVLTWTDPPDMPANMSGIAIERNGAYINSVGPGAQYYKDTDPALVGVATQPCYKARGYVVSISFTPPDVFNQVVTYGPYSNDTCGGGGLPFAPTNLRVQ